MKSFIVVALVMAVAAAVPIDPSSSATILRYDANNIGVEGYNYAVETSDGKSAAESGQLTNVGTENEALVVRGQFSYIGTDGRTYLVTYTADQNGFQPKGDHIPQ